MHIVVCVKQTPTAAEARLDPATNKLVREGVTLSVSSIDKRALLEALRLRSQVGGEVTVVTMGPPQARQALVDMLALGADKGIHLSDPLFAGSDTLATARVLSNAIRKLNPDLVMCGRFTVDSETGQVPSELADMLEMPQLTLLRKIATTDGGKTLNVERETDDGADEYNIRLPALLSVTELVIANRRIEPADLEAAKSKPLETWDGRMLNLDESQVGPIGSPTRVGGLRSAGLQRQGRIVQGDNPEEAARELATYLVKAGIFEENPKRLTERKPRHKTRREVGRRGGPAIWVVAELRKGKVLPVTHELLGKAQDIADAMKGHVVAMLVGEEGVERLAGELGAYGADRVYVAAKGQLATYDTAMYTDVLCNAIRMASPAVVLLPSTANGRDWAPRVAARLNLGLTGDCVDIEVDKDGKLAQIKPAFGGNIVCPIYTRTSPIVATVRPGMLVACQPDWNVEPQVDILEVRVNPDRRIKLLKSTPEPMLATAPLDEADAVVAVGLGVGGAENLGHVKQLADSLHGAVAATLRVVERGWLPNQLQIGLTGKAVAPRFYFAIGLSGAANHVMGIKRAERIIAINQDAKAAIFGSADFGIVGDLNKVLPALNKALSEARVAR